MTAATAARCRITRLRSGECSALRRETNATGGKAGERGNETCRLIGQENCYRLPGRHGRPHLAGQLPGTASDLGVSEPPDTVGHCKVRFVPCCHNLKEFIDGTLDEVLFQPRVRLAGRTAMIQ